MTLMVVWGWMLHKKAAPAWSITTTSKTGSGARSQAGYSFMRDAFPAASSLPCDNLVDT